METYTFSTFILPLLSHDVLQDFPNKLDISSNKVTETFTNVDKKKSDNSERFYAAVKIYERQFIVNYPHTDLFLAVTDFLFWILESSWLWVWLRTFFIQLEIFHLQRLARKYINVYSITEKMIYCCILVHISVITITTKPVLMQIFLRSVLTSFRNWLNQFINLLQNTTVTKLCQS